MAWKCHNLDTQRRNNQAVYGVENCGETYRIIMTQDTSTYYVWIGGSCDYGHKERAGGAAVVIEHISAF